MAKRHGPRRSGSSEHTRVPGREPRDKAAAGSGAVWLYGHHAVTAALGNPLRQRRRLVAVADVAPEIEAQTGIAPEILKREALSALLPPDAVHQGVALAVDPLPPLNIEDIVEAAETAPAPQIVVLLDQVTDPHNIGAVLRSAAAFGALAVVVPEHGAPQITGSLAKAASGAAELVPLIRVVNLVRALETLKEGGFWSVGLDGEAEKTLPELAMTGKVVLALGAEGPGLRRLTRDRCDHLAKLPTRGAIRSLNVSNAAAVALYELTRSTAP